MRTSLLILGVGAAALSIRRNGAAPIDPEPETRRFVKSVSKYPGLAFPVAAVITLLTNRFPIERRVSQVMMSAEQGGNGTRRSDLP